MPKSFEEYRDAFLGDCFIKARAPGSYFWCGEHAVLSGQLAVIHAVPLYAYVGFEPNDGQEFELVFREVRRNCNIDPRKSTDGDIVQIKRRPGADRVKKYLDYWKKQNAGECYSIKILSEIPSRCGLNGSGAALSAIASILQILEVQECERRSLIKKINNWGKTPIPVLKRDPVFRAAFNKSWIMDSCAHNFLGDGAAPLSSLVGSFNGDLLLHLTEEKTFDLDYPNGQLSRSPSDLQPKELLRIEERIKTVDWWGKRLPIREDLKDWLAIALVYCGIPADTAKILPRLESIHRTPVEDFRSLFSDLFPEAKTSTRLARPMSDFISGYNEHKLDTKLFLKTVFRESLGLLSWELVSILKQGDVTKLLNHIIAIHKFMDFYGVVPEELSKHIKAIKEESNVGVKLTGAGGGGDLVVFGESDSMEGIEERIKQSYHIHYSTNKMGWKASGLSVIRYGIEDDIHVPSSESVTQKHYCCVLTEEGERKYTAKEYKAHLARGPSKNNKKVIWIDLTSGSFWAYVNRKHKKINLTGNKKDMMCLFLEKFGKLIPIEDLREVTKYPDQVIDQLHDETHGVLGSFLTTHTGEGRTLQLYSKNRRKKFTFCLIKPIAKF